MPDIKMCSGNGCDLKNYCLRHTSEPSGERQSWTEPPNTTPTKCDDLLFDLTAYKKMPSKTKLDCPHCAYVKSISVKTGETQSCPACEKMHDSDLKNTKHNEDSKSAEGWMRPF